MDNVRCLFFFTKGKKFFKEPHKKDAFCNNILKLSLKVFINVGFLGPILEESGSKLGGQFQIKYWVNVICLKLLKQKLVTVTTDT